MIMGHKWVTQSDEKSGICMEDVAGESAEKPGISALRFSGVKDVSGAESMDGMPDMTPEIPRTIRPPVIW